MLVPVGLVDGSVIYSGQSWARRGLRAGACGTGGWLSNLQRTILGLRAGACGAGGWLGNLQRTILGLPAGAYGAGGWLGNLQRTILSRKRAACWCLWSRVMGSAPLSEHGLLFHWDLHLLWSVVFILQKA